MKIATGIGFSRVDISGNSSRCGADTAVCPNFLALDLKAMETDVALPGIGVFGNHQAGTDDRPAVALPGDMDRQLREV